MRLRVVLLLLPLVLLLLLVLGACRSSSPPPQPPPPPPQYYSAPPPPPPPAAPPSAPTTCAAEGGYDCTPDRKALTICRGGRIYLASTCRGARGCMVGNAIDCDHSVAAAGDPCDGPKEIACALDGKQMLRCNSNKYQPAEPCRNACLATSGRVLCQ